MTGSELKAEIVRRGVRQGEVALKMGIHHSDFSRFLSGVKPMPENFEADCLRAIEEAVQDKIRQLVAASPTAGAAA